MLSDWKQFSFIMQLSWCTQRWAGVIHDWKVGKVRKCAAEIYISLLYRGCHRRAGNSGNEASFLVVTGQSYFGKEIFADRGVLLDSDLGRSSFLCHWLALMQIFSWCWRPTRRRNVLRSLGCMVRHLQDTAILTSRQCHECSSKDIL